MALLWTIKSEYGILEEFITFVKAMYNKFECGVLKEAEVTEVPPGVKQGRMLSSFLFSIFLQLTGSKLERVQELVYDGSSTRYWKTQTLQTITPCFDVDMLTEKIDLQTSR